MVILSNPLGNMTIEVLTIEGEYSNINLTFQVGGADVADSKTVLISMIGKGRTKEGEKGYDKTSYYFDEIDKDISTSFFGSALYKVLINLQHDVDKWLIFGTNRSSWSELLYTIDEKYHDEVIELYDKVYDEENKGISQELLSQWQHTLGKYIPGIHLIIVDPLDYKIYIDHMIKEIPDEKRKLVLDITHAFRHMPVIIAFSLMTLKHIKDISDIMVYYGAFELKGDKQYTPVIKMDFINTLVSYAENLATYKYSGYFPPLLELLGLPNTQRTYFWLEMNRQPRTYLEKINLALDKISIQDDYQSTIAEYVKKDLSPLIGASLDKRMVERGKFFFDKKQYLKALILVYEGIIIAIGRKYKDITPLAYDAREEIRRFVKNNKNDIFKSELDRETYKELTFTRNAAVHGSPPRGTQQYVEEQEYFESLFNRSLKLYESIVEEGIHAPNI